MKQSGSGWLVHIMVMAQLTFGSDLAAWLNIFIISTHKSDTKLCRWFTDEQ
jgi:hypothetical protein